MPVVAVVNRKGGSGKSTLSTHLAAYCAHSGMPVMLGDVDRQQSTQAWLRLRSQQNVKSKADIVGWAVDARSVLRRPVGVNHVILDTPGGLTGFELARVAVFADAILMPVCNSVFDRESAADCYAELLTMPRIASGRCKVAAVGMRVDVRSRGEDMLRAWAQQHNIHFLGALRESQRYVRSVEQGLTLFDSPPSRVSSDLAQWQPILQWLQPVFYPPEAPSTSMRPIDQMAAPLRSAASPSTHMSALSHLPHADPLAGLPSSPLRAATPSAPLMHGRHTGMGDRVGGWLSTLGLSRLLQR